MHLVASLLLASLFGASSAFRALDQFERDLAPAEILHKPVVSWVGAHSRLEVWVIIRRAALFNCTAFQPYRISGYMGTQCTLLCP